MPRPGAMVPPQKSKNFKGSIKKLMSYIGRFKIQIFLVMLFAAASTVFSVMGPKILGKATTGLAEGLMAKIQGTGGIDFEYIGRILVFVLAIYAISAIFNFAQGMLMTGVTQKVCYQLRRDISQKINRMPMKYFESRTYGEVLSRITNDVDTLGQGLNQSITQIITSTATLIGVLIMMLSISPLMTLIALVILPISGALVSFTVKKSQRFFIKQQEYLGHINGQVEETFGGQNVIKLFNKEQETLDEFNRTNKILYDSAWKSQFFSGMMQPIMMFVGNLGYAGVALSGGILAAKGRITVGDADDKIRLNQRKPSKYKGLRRFGPEKNSQRINKFMKERPIFYKNLIQMKDNFRYYLRCFYCITKVVILQFNKEKQDRISSQWVKSI